MNVILEVEYIYDAEAEECYDVWRDTLGDPYPRWLERSPEYRAAFALAISRWIEKPESADPYIDIAPSLGYDVPWHELSPTTREAITAIYERAMDIRKSYNDFR